MILQMKPKVAGYRVPLVWGGWGGWLAFCYVQPFSGLDEATCVMVTVCVILSYLNVNLLQKHP